MSGLTIAGVVYALVLIVAVALVPVGTLADSDTPLVEVVKAGAPGLPIEDILPFISMFAVVNIAVLVQQYIVVGGLMCSVCCCGR